MQNLELSFPAASTDLLSLVEQAKRFIEAAQAPSTRKAYAADLSDYGAFCARIGQPTFALGGEVLALHVTDLAGAGKKPATIARRVAAIATQYHASGYSETPASSFLVKEVLRGMRRTLGVAQERKSPLLIADIERIVASSPVRLIGLRDQALILLGFASGCRRAELATIEVRDLELTSEGLVLTIQRGKTDQQQQGRQVPVAVGARPETCPVRAVTAWLIAFTGTPVMKRDKSTIEKFGGLIAPSYTIRNAVDDEAVVPLLYEGRHAQQRVDQAAIDEWFERTTRDLTTDQRTDLKKKFAKPDRLFRAEPMVKAIAWDISEHFAKSFKGTAFKGQLVAPRKETAIQYKEFLDQFGKVRSEVLISPPDDREGEEDIYKDNTDVVNRFWKAAMVRYGTAKQYEQTILNSFKYGDPRDEQQGTPEIIIVVDKLLTGFDCPANTVLYLARSLKEHTLLQAIARVNRLFPGKDYGFIIDYRGVLPDLDEALSLYSELPEFDEEDLADTVTEIRVAIDKLPQKHSALWDVFKTIRNKSDLEAYERLLADDALRVEFYDRFATFARSMSVALSSETFFERTPEERVDRYKKDLKFFHGLRQSVRRRYAETVDLSEYEPKIQKLLNTYLLAEQVEPITATIDIFNRDARLTAIAAVHGQAAQADMIAHNTQRVLRERWEREDPAFFKKFSRMLQDVIDDFRAHRLQAAQYLSKATEIMEATITRSGDEIPETLANNEVCTNPWTRYERRSALRVL